MKELVEFCSNVGFPIVISVYLLISQNKVLSEMKEHMISLTDKINALCDKLGGET